MAKVKSIEGNNRKSQYVKNDETEKHQDKLI